MKQESPLRVAIVGSGPSGIFAADALVKSEVPTVVDVFERLPAPFGLVRYGVAPDHTRIKQIQNTLASVLERSDIRLLANVTVGTDVTLAELRAHYDAVIFATGAIRDAPLGVPGADLAGSFGSAEFVSWYDGHPDAPRTWPLTAREVAVIGVGNVALDIARILSKRPQDLAWTDMPDAVMAGLATSPVTDVHIFGRRGPIQVKFSPLELREIGEIPGVDVIVHANNHEFDGMSLALTEGRHQGKQVHQTLVDWTEREPTGAPRRIHLHFFQRPASVIDDGEGNVAGIRMERVRLTEDGSIEGTGEIVDYPVQAVYAAVGYRGNPLEGVPFDETRGVIPNIEGRVVGSDGAAVPGLYVTGWIKRGPSGLIGSSKSDAHETVGNLLADAEARGGARLAEAGGETSNDPLDLLRSRGVPVIHWSGWEALDAYENAAGRANGRDRIKVASRDEMIDIAMGRA